VNVVTQQAFMQHLDGSGALASGFPPDGMVLPITLGGPTGYLVLAVTDDAGGAYVMWNHWNGNADAANLTRITGSGGFAPGWSASGVQQLTTDPFSPPFGFGALALAPDASGGALTGGLVSVEGVGTVGNFTHSGPGGATPTSFGTGVPPSVGGPVGMVADGAGGLFGAWRASAAPSPRMQHFLANGSAAWPQGTAAPVSNVLLRDGSGGIYLVGDAGVQLQIHRRASDTSIPSPWTAAGVVVSGDGPFTAIGGVVSGGLVYTVWSSGSGDASDIRASAVTPDGAIAPGWVANGNSVCDAPNAQVMTSMLPMPPTDALVVWADARSGEPDVYASRLSPSGPPTLGVPPGSRQEAFALALSPNPSSRVALASFTLPEASPAALELVDVAGRVVAHVELEPRSGRQSLALDIARLPGGVYWAHLRQLGRTTATRFAVVH
jgi:hypothetical protein